MDRFYLGKLVEDINQGVRQTLEQGLARHLAWFMALDHRVETGERHLKMLRFLYALDAQCPSEHLLGLQNRISLLCQRFSGSDYHCRFHFGYDDWVPVDEPGYTFALQFYLLENQMDHSANRRLVAGLLDDPENQSVSLPRWLSHEEPLPREDLENEVLCFAQQFVSSKPEHLFQVRRLEAAFWRVVNLGCWMFYVDTYEELVDFMPARFKPAMMQLPESWDALRRQESQYSDEDLLRCERDSLRFCRLLMEIR